MLSYAVHHTLGDEISLRGQSRSQISNLSFYQDQLLINSHFLDSSAQETLLHHSVTALAEDETTIQGSHGCDCSSRRKSMRLFAFSLNTCISNHVSSMRPWDLSWGLSPNNILMLMIQPATNHVTTNHNPHFYTNKSY